MPEKASASVYLKLIAMRRPGQVSEPAYSLLPHWLCGTVTVVACAGRIARGICAGDRDGVNATRSRAGALSTQLHEMVVYDHPVGCRVAIAKLLIGSLLVTLSTQLTADGVQLSAVL